jgi:glycosyltransferase involved in cell wall biosynthesis
MSMRFPRKVCMTTDAVGGVWTYALEVAHGLGSAGIHVDLAVLGPQPSRPQREFALKIPGLKLIETQLPLDWTAGQESELDRAAKALQALASAGGADLVHLNAPAHAGLDRWSQPLVVAAHSCVATWWRACHSAPMPPDFAWRAERTGRGLKIADLVLAPSRSFARQLEDTYGTSGPIRVVHNCRRSSARMPVARDRILTAGRLWDEAKDAASIDRAAALLASPIFAAGPTRGPNGERATFASLRLLGTLDEPQMRQQYARTRLFVSVSRYEPFGLCVLEAAHAGCALLLSNIASFKELWRGAALFVPANDPVALAHNIDWLEAHGEVREDLARRARVRAARYSPRRLLASTLLAYQDARVAHLRHAPSRTAA